MTTAEILADNIKRTKTMTENLLADFTEEQMLYRPAKGANHAMWQLGHLATSTWWMISQCDPSMKSAAGEDKRFAKEASGVDDAAKFPKKGEVVKAFSDAMDAAAAWAGRLTEEQLGKAGPEKIRSFAPTVGQVALLLGTHPMMHVGQYSVIRRALGKAVLF